MNVSESSFIKRYVTETAEALQLIYPNLPYAYLHNFVGRKIQQHFKDQPVHIGNDYAQISTDSTLLNVIDYIENEKPIIAANGSFYQKHSKGIAPSNGMLLALGKDRKSAKKKMFQARENNDMQEYDNLNLLQGNIKIIMNSFYGALGQKNSFGYNAATAAGITAQGRSVISTTVWFNEAFLGNNIYFKSIDELVRYIKYIMDEENHLELFDIIENVPDDNELVRYYMAHYEAQDVQLAAAIVHMIVKHATQTQKIKLLYKNNLYEFIERNSKVKAFILDDIIRTPDIYNNPYEIPEGLQQPLQQLWTWLEEFVYLKPYIMYDKVDRYRTHKRRIIVYSDTDSVFIYTGDWLFNFMNWDTGIKYSDIKMTKIDTEYALKIINIFIHIAGVGIHKTYDTLAGNMGIEDEYRKQLAIKNELLMDRYITFNMQKNYVYRTIVNEGNILHPPKFEVKGTHLNAKSKNRIVSSRLQSIVEHVTMDDDVIYPEVLLQEIYKFRDEIIASLNKGETTYLVPAKIKSGDNYANPYQLFTVRAFEAYRVGSGDQTASLPGTFNIIDTIGMETLQELESLKTTFPEIYTRFEKEYFSDKALAKGGIKYIALPMRFETIPDWIKPYININEICRKHLHSSIALLPSVGIRQDVIKGNAYYSTVLRF